MSMRLVVVLLLASFSVFADEASVQTNLGPIQGKVTDLAREFLGIPYAKPPVGQLRWTYPVPPAPWTTPIQATTFTAGCAQACNLPPLTCPDTISEDCLTLNIYTPRLSEITQPLPVMFFVPGGRFEQGAAGTWLYWGDNLVNSSKVVLVTINYRLGAFGWLASTKIPGNYGLQDQRLALQWTRDNIAYFGGDPRKITLFGQSAGGTSTSVHLTSKASQGLFDQAIIHSNPFTLPLQDPISASYIAKEFALVLGCVPDDLACMRSKTTDQLIKASTLANDHVNTSDPVAMFYPWVPNIDGVLVDGQPLELFAKGQFNQVPIMIGNVEEEALLFIWELQEGRPADYQEYTVWLQAVFGTTNTQKVLGMYPNTGHNSTDYRYVLSQLGTDWIFNCPNRVAATGISNTNKSLPLFFYRFDHVLSFDGWGPNYSYCVGQVCHGAELVYLFQSEACDDSGFLFTSEEQVMADQLGRLWTNFAWTANPNTPPKINTFYANLKSYVDVTWPQWSPQNDLRLTIESPSYTLVSNWRQSYCDFWDQLGYLNPKA